MALRHSPPFAAPEEERALPIVRRGGRVHSKFGGFATIVGTSPRLVRLLEPESMAALSDETWATLAAQFGRGLGNPHWTPDDLRASVADAVAVYLDWEPDGRRPVRMTRKALAARARQIGAAARKLRVAFTTVHKADELTELKFVVSELARTGSGAWVDWGALQRVLEAVEDAAVDAVVSLPRAERSGPRDDPAFLDLVKRLAELHAHWHYGKWPPTPEQLPSMPRNPMAERRAEQPWDYTGPFADILYTIIQSIPALRRRRGLGDLAARYLTRLRKSGSARD